MNRVASSVINHKASESQRLRRDREEVWYRHVTGCDKCGAAANKLIYHEDGVQCFNCNRIIYMPEAATLAEMFPNPEAILQEIAKQADPPRPAAKFESSEPDLKPVEKPENWDKMGQRAKKAWYDDHKEEITSDYNSSMSRDAVLAKWGMSASTLWSYSKRWGIVSKRKRGPKGPRPSVAGKVEPVLSPKRSEPPVLVITKKDLANCSDAKFTKIWDILGRIIRGRTSNYSPKIIYKVVKSDAEGQEVADEQSK